jgi:CRISPR-associated protein Cas1
MKIIVGRDDAGIVYAITPGTYITKKADALIIAVTGEEERSMPLKDVAHVCLKNNCQITTQALLSVIKKSGTINYISGGGWLEAVTQSPLSKNIGVRKKQFERFMDEKFVTDLARNIIFSKISNQRTLTN